MKKFYIAARLENAPKVQELRDLLIGYGWQITYDWTTHGNVRDGRPQSELDAIARKELGGVLKADVVIGLLPGGRGTHCELGAALASVRRVILWSETGAELERDERSTVFYHMQECEHAVGLTMKQLAFYVNATEVAR